MKRILRKIPTMTTVVTFAVMAFAVSCAPHLKPRLPNVVEKTVEPKPQCRHSSPEVALTVVGYCVYKDEFWFRAGSKVVSLKQRRYMERIRENLVHLLNRSPYPKSTLTQAMIEVWMTTAPLDPKAADLRIVLIGKGGNLVIRQPLDPDRWSIGQRDVALLGENAYPSYKAKQAGRLDVHFRHSTTPEERRNFLKGVKLDRKIYAAGYGSGHWGDDRAADPMLHDESYYGHQRVQVPLFRELEILYAIRSHPRAAHVLERATMVPASYPQSNRSLIARFPFDPENYRVPLEHGVHEPLEDEEGTSATPRDSDREGAA